jgi:hypothetical protein
MSLGSILVIAALLLFVIAFVGRPLVEGRGFGVSSADRKFSELLAARDRVLASISDLDMDMALQKIPAEDYETRRAELLQEGAGILRDIDDLADDQKLPLAGTASGDGSLEAQLEAQILRLRQTKEDGAGFCPQCGRPLVSGDRFCSHCGYEVATDSVSS